MVEMTGRRGRRRKKLLDDFEERRGHSLLKKEALDRTMWRARFGRGFGLVVRQTTKWTTIFILSSKIFLRLQFSGCKIAVKVKFVYAMRAYYIYTSKRR